MGDDLQDTGLESEGNELEGNESEGNEPEGNETVDLSVRIEALENLLKQQADKNEELEKHVKELQVKNREMALKTGVKTVPKEQVNLFGSYDRYK